MNRESGLGYLLSTIVVLFAASSSQPAMGAELITPPGFLPAIEKLFSTLNSEGSEREAILLKSLTLICPTHLKNKLPGCNVDTEIAAYKAKVATLFSPSTSPIAINGEAPRSPWDLREIAAGNFAPMPSVNGANDGILLATEVLFLRRKIAGSLNQLQKTLDRHSRGLARYTLVPSLRAHFLGASPFGHALILFDSIRCDLKDTLCLNIQARLGALLNLIIPTFENEILEIKHRMTLALSGDLGERARRLGEVLTLNRQLLDPNSRLEWNPLLSAIHDLTADGQGSFADEAYQDMARTLIVLAEADLVVSPMAKFTPYQQLANESEIQSAKDLLLPKFSQSISAIKTSMAALGFKTELEEN